MSKRGAGNWGGDEERYGGASGADMDGQDKPTQATAAQLARRNNTTIQAIVSAAGLQHVELDNMVTGVVPFSLGGVVQGIQPPVARPRVIRIADGDTLEGKFSRLNIGDFPFPSWRDAEAEQHYLAIFTDKNRLLKPKARSDRGRSDSPAVQPQVNPFNQAATNPFTASSFNFTASQPQQANGAAYQFGQPAPTPSNQSQQNGTSNIFSQSQTPSFGGFGSMAPQSQPQQNGTGFNASTMLFNQPSQQSTTPSFGGFGQNQNQQSHQNGTTTPATSFSGFSNASQPSNQNGTSNVFNGFGGKQTESENQPANPFPSFGQKAQQNGAPASNGFSGFGQQTQESSNSRASTPAFGGTFGQKPSEQNDKSSNNLFGQKPQEKEQGTSLFTAFGQKEANGQAKNPFVGFNGFGQKAAEDSNKPLFTTPAPQPASQTTTTSSSTTMFGQTPTSQAPAPTSGLFGSATPSSATAPGTGLFGSKPITNEPAKSGASIFDNLPKKATGSSKINFSSADPSQVYNGEDDDEETRAASPEKAAESQPPKTNIFAGLGQSQQPSKPTTSLFAQSTSQNQTLFGNSTSQQSANSSTTSATPQKSLFASSTPAATTQVSSTPATQPPRSMFDRISKPQPDETPKAPLFSTTLAPTPTAKSLFQSTTPAAAHSTPSTAPSLFQKSSATPVDDETPKAAPPKNIFAQSSAAPFTPATTSAGNFKAPPATAPVARVSAPLVNSASTSAKASTTASKLSAAQQQSMKALNDGLLAHLRTQRPDVDWSPIYRYALAMAAQIAGRPVPSNAELHPAPSSQPAPSAAPAKAAAISTDFGPSASNLFAQTPKGASAVSSSTAPATVPSKKRLFEEDAEEVSRVPATEKRSKPNDPPSYPKLPDGASNTAKLFASTLDKSETPKASASSGFTPSTKPLFSASASTPVTMAAATPATGGFKPTFGDAKTSATTTTASGFKPTVATVSAGSSFLSSFGALAKKQEDADRQKRKAEDYDSEEETEEQWAARDKAEQEEKRRKLAEAAKTAPSFSIGAATPKAATAKEAEKAQGTGDKTWNPDTPLKFNFAATTTTTPATAPPKFGNIFGAASSTNDAGSKLAAPAISLSASRATTPGNTTDGDAASTANGDKTAADDGEPSDEPNQAQVSDEINDLQPAEREANDVLLEVQDVRTSKMEKDEESGKQIWKPKTRGRFFILSDKDTGKIRMLSRTGAGRTVLNHAPNKEATFKVHPKKATMIVASMFIDHLHTTPPGPGQWMFSTPDKDDASKIAQILTDGTPK